MKNKLPVLILFSVFLFSPMAALAGGLPDYSGNSNLISSMLEQNISIETIYLILAIPVIATIIAFARQIVGFTALGVYIPVLVAAAFMIIGVEYGAALFVFVGIIGSIGRLIARKIRLAYLPRMAIVVSLVSFAIFGFYYFSARFDYFFAGSLDVFPILVMGLLTEKFISVQVEQGNKRALALFLETLFLAIVCIFLVNWGVVRNFILNYPYSVLGTLVINFIIGKWTGLRLFEFYRFRKVIKHVELAEKK